jgi:hypothetical protein
MINVGDISMSYYNNMPLITDVYVNIQQASLILSVNRLTIRRWLNQGKIHGQKIGTVTLLFKDEILAIAKERNNSFGTTQ